MSGRLGIYLVGARGDVALLVRVGAAALARGIAGDAGVVTTHPDLAALDLAPWESLVIGGCDIRRADPVRTARALAYDERLFRPDILFDVEDDLRAAESRIGPGYLSGAGPAVVSLAGPDILDARTAAEAAGAVRRDLARFRDEAHADRLVCVNLASTEAAPPYLAFYDDLPALEAAMANPEAGVPASVVYAHAALSSGVPYINFTPSAGSSIPAIRDLARQRGVPHAGRDGKTGETFVKSVLAPALAARGFRVRSWSGVNLLGNRDGQALEDPGAKRAKSGTKDRTLKAILGDRLGESLVRIDYVESLGDRKTFWDYVDIEGFLGSEVALQIQWRASDSALAAPLVLDLLRLTDLAARRGEAGELAFLACFFKDPLGTAEMSFPAQFQMLLDWARSQRAAPHPAPSTPQGAP